MLTKQIERFASVFFGSALVLIAVLGLIARVGDQASARAAGVTHYVATSGLDVGDCTIDSLPCRTIQYAVDVAASGDEVLIASGVYTGVNLRPQRDVTDTGTVKQIVYISKTISLRGGYTTVDWITAQPHTQITTLDAEHQGRVIYITGKITPTIEGVYLAQGSDTGLGGGRFNANAAGGVYVISATATLSNNVIYSNTGSNGGGLFFYESPSLVMNSSILSNTGNFGGGVSAFSISAGGLTFRGNLIQGNQAALGGAFMLPYANVRVTIDRNSIVSNTASNGGGGVYIQQSGFITLSGNTIEANLAPQAGGVAIVSVSTMVLTGNVIANNHATSSDGGGVYLSNSPAKMLGNLIVSNTAASGNGGGVFLLQAPAQLLSNTISSNTANNGGGIHAEGLTVGLHVIRNNEIARNTASNRGGGADLFTFSNLADVDHNAFMSNTASNASGGGLFSLNGITLTANTFMSNTSGASGGGAFLQFCGARAMAGNQFISNTAQSGGGVAASVCSNPAFNQNLIRGNTASDSGGGLYLSGSSLIGSNNVLIDNYAANTGSGIKLLGNGNPQLRHTTLARNTGGDGSGVAIESTGSTGLIMLNTILINQTIGISASLGATVTLDSVLWFGNGANTGGAASISITHAYTGTPAFAGDGYHILGTSTAINKGVSTSVNTDIDGDPRPSAGVSDLGVDEYQFTHAIYLPLALKNF
jgi:parallel beta-helix repeat protein